MGRKKVKVVGNVSVKYKSTPQTPHPMECPFIWLTEAKRGRYLVSHFKMLKMLKQRADCFSPKYRRFERFIVDLCVMYEYYYLPRKEAAFAKMKDIEDEFISALKNQTDDFYRDIKDVIYHVIISSQMYLFYDRGSDEEILKKPQHVFLIDNTLSNIKSTLEGIKSCFYSLYGCYGLAEASETIKSAINLSHEPYWLYVKSRYLGLGRRSDRPLYCCPLVDEIKLLETALRYSKDPLYMITTAKLLLETAKVLTRSYRYTDQWKPFSVLVDKLYCKSACMLMDSIKTDPVDPEILIQCAEGFIEIPGEEVVFVKHIIEEGLKKLPDHGLGNFLAGKFCEKFTNEVRVAKHHYIIAFSHGIFEAGMRLLHLDCYTTSDQKIDVLERLAQINELDFDLSHQLEILCQIVSFYILIKNDIHMALAYMREIMTIRPFCDQVLHHSSLFVLMQPMSLYNIVINAVYVRTKECVCSDTELTLLAEFVRSVSKLEISVPPCPKNLRDLRVQILDNAGCLKYEFMTKFRLNYVSPEYRNVLQELNNYCLLEKSKKKKNSRISSVHYKSIKSKSNAKNKPTIAEKNV